MIRLSKILMLMSIAFFFAIVAFDNVIDFNANWPFVQHVLSMDTTFKDPVLMKRAIDKISIYRISYFLIIAWEFATAVICFFGVFVLVRYRNSKPHIFDIAKKWGVFGLVMGFMLYMFGFITVGGEWFAMWQSSVWNGQGKAGLFCTLIGLTLVFLAQNEQC